MKRFFLVLSFAALLAACQSPPPTSAPTTAPPRVAAVATNTARPAATATPPTAAPTNTPLPTATPAATETLTPAPTATPTATPAPATREAYVSSDNGLNLRSDPSSAATVLRTLADGARLTAIGAANPPDASGIAWQNVQTEEGQSGWVAAQFLIDTKPAAAASTAPPPTPLPPGVTPVVTPIAASGYVYVAAPDGLNLRADKSSSSQLLATLANGQRLQTNGLGYGPDAGGITWLNVETEQGMQGWVARQFVSDQVPSVAPAAPAVNASEAVAEILRRTNDLRRESGVAEVTLIDDLNHLALDHSQYMAQNGISHTGAGQVSAKQRIANAGYGAGCPTENIYGGQASIDDAWNYWITDPPHLAVLLNTCNNVLGIGVYKTGFMTYYTMDFGKPAQ